MSSILIISRENQAVANLRMELGRSGFACSVTPDGEDVIEQIAEQPLDLVLVDIDNHLRIWELSRRIKQERHLPVIALVTKEMLDNDDGHLDMTDDFVIKPYDLRELKLRIKRLLHITKQTDSGELIACGDLLINLAKCEVTLCGGVVMLTFMEYELLKFLAGNRGRVFTREVLLNKVWGYDYFGGDRTVDVHIRRLRSKLEDSTHTFLETVRNIGYRFRENN